MLKDLFLGFFRIGVVGYGGGPASLPLVKREFVDNNKVLSEDEFIELIAICNMLPGPIITKVAAVIGHKNKGFLGALASLLGIVLPSLFILTLLITFFYEDARSNPAVQMMINAVIPVVAVMMINLVTGVVTKSRKKFNNDMSLAIQVIIYGVMFIGLDISSVYVILGLILFVFFLPAKKPEEVKGGVN